MNGKEKIMLDRVVFILIAVILIASVLVLYGILGVDASFVAGIGALETVQSEIPDDIMTAIDEPDDAYQLAKLTFGGTCTPASMLGSDSFGTFNYAYANSGAEYFLDCLSDTFSKDDFTLVGLSAVFSDRTDLVAAEKTFREWYRSSTRTASVFSKGGVDALSLECSRTMDYGIDGYSDTKSALESQSLLWSDSGKAIYQTLTGGINVAIYCCTYSAETLPGIHSWIAEAVKSNDFVALYITDTDDSYIVSDEKRAAYRSFIDSGADLVVGSNGEKLQPAEEWGDGYIVYSLGSLIDGASKYSEQYTALLQVSIRSDFGEIIGVEYELIPCVTYDSEHSWQPKVIDEGDDYKNILDFMNGEREFPN